MQFDVFQKDYSHAVTNIKRLMQQTGAKAKGLLRGGNADRLKFRQKLFEVSEELIIICTHQPDPVECQKIQEGSSDIASESDEDGE